MVSMSELAIYHVISVNKFWLRHKCSKTKQNINRYCHVFWKRVINYSTFFATKVNHHSFDRQEYRPNCMAAAGETNKANKWQHLFCFIELLHCYVTRDPKRRPIFLLIVKDSELAIQPSDKNCNKCIMVISTFYFYYDKVYNF